MTSLITSVSQPITANPSTSVFSSPASPSLQTSAKVGIGIGVPLGVIAALMMLFLLWSKRRSKITLISEKRRRRRSGWRAYFQNKAELDAEGQGIFEAEDTEQRQELDANLRHELEVVETRQELVGAEHAQELGS